MSVFCRSSLSSIPINKVQFPLNFHFSCISMRFWGINILFLMLLLLPAKLELNASCSCVDCGEVGIIKCKRAKIHWLLIANFYCIGELWKIRYTLVEGNMLLFLNSARSVFDVVLLKINMNYWYTVLLNLVVFFIFKKTIKRFMLNNEPIILTNFVGKFVNAAAKVSSNTKNKICLQVSHI